SGRDGGRTGARTDDARRWPLAAVLTGGPIACWTFHRIGGVHMNASSGRTRFFVALLMMLVACATLAAPADAATLTVCASGCGYITIAAAIAAASAGDTIDILDALHNESNITVGKSLTIQGQGLPNTIVQAADEPGSGAGRIFSVPAGVTVTIQD